MQSRARALDNGMGSKPQHFCADTNDAPAQCLEFGLLVDVLGADRRVRPVLFAVVLDTDLPLGPAHIDAVDVVAKAVEDVDLCSSRPRPAPVSTRRVRVSCGDSAPTSASLTTSRNCTIPRAPRWRSISVSMSANLSAVACRSASTRITASVRPYRRPWSKAVRAAVVTGIPRTISISSVGSVSLCNTISLVLRWLAWLSSAGKRESIHLALCIAAAEMPTTVAWRRDHNHAA